MQVTVLLTRSAAAALRGDGERAADSPDLLAALAELDVELEPIDDGDPESWFVAEVADVDEAERVIERLGGSGAVEAIYVKPPDEAP